MSTNADLVTPERYSRYLFKVPRWADAIVSAGIVSANPDIRRRQRFANIAAYALGLDAVVHLLTNMAYDAQALLPVNAYNFVAIIVFFSLHRLHRFGERVMANVLVAFALAGHSYVVFAFGLASNLHVYFTMAGVILFFVGVRYWRNFLVLYALALATLFLTMGFATEHGFVMEDDPAFRQTLAWQALVSAFVLNAIVIAYALVALNRAERTLQSEYERAERLLTSILPASIAARLKSGREKQIADRLENVSVLFVDLVGFTPAAGSATPEEVVDYLHRLFSRFDALCDAHGVDKIKTIGDSYMAVGGLDGRWGAGAAGIARVAIAMRDCMAGEKLAGRRLEMRAGIHAGPVVAGVIGDRRVAYDVWGNTVNIASRVESSGQPGRIHVTETFRRMVEKDFSFEPRGPVELKGAGMHDTFFLA